MEVLSTSTRVFDSGEKFEDYKLLESLEEYVLISQASQQVECRRRTSTNTWEASVYQVGDRVLLKSIDQDLRIDRKEQMTGTVFGALSLIFAPT